MKLIEKYFAHVQVLSNIKEYYYYLCVRIHRESMKIKKNREWKFRLFSGMYLFPENDQTS